MSAGKRNKKRKRMKGFGLLIVLSALLCGVIWYATEGVRKERDEKLAKKQELERQIAVQYEETERLEIEKEYTGTRKFVEEMARKVLGLVYPDEVVFEEKED